MVVAVLLLLLTGGVAVAQEGPGNVVRCDGGRCEGTDARDIFLSSDKPEEVIGKAGDDDDIELDATIAGGTNDLAFGDLGRDCIDGGAGDDVMIGDDTLAARDGDCDDFLDGGPGTDDCSADPGDVVSNCENGESQPGDQGGSAPPQSGAEPNRAPDPMSSTTLFGSTRTTTALRGGLITVPGMAVNCGVGPCMVDERLLAAERKRVEGSARAGGKRRGLVGATATSWRAARRTRSGCGCPRRPIGGCDGAGGSGCRWW